MTKHITQQRQTRRRQDKTYKTKKDKHTCDKRHPLHWTAKEKKKGGGARLHKYTRQADPNPNPSPADRQTFLKWWIPDTGSFAFVSAPDSLVWTCVAVLRLACWLVFGRVFYLALPFRFWSLSCIFFFSCCLLFCVDLHCIALPCLVMSCGYLALSLRVLCGRLTLWFILWLYYLVVVLWSSCCCLVSCGCLALSLSLSCLVLSCLVIVFSCLVNVYHISSSSRIRSYGLILSLFFVVSYLRRFLPFRVSLDCIHRHQELDNSE